MTSPVADCPSVRLQGEIPEHSAAGGDDAEDVVPSDPHPTGLRSLHSGLRPCPDAPRHIHLHTTTQAQGPAPHTCQGENTRRAADVHLSTVRLRAEPETIPAVIG